MENKMASGYVRWSWEKCKRRLSLVSADYKVMFNNLCCFEVDSANNTQVD